MVLERLEDLEQYPSPGYPESRKLHTSIILRLSVAERVRGDPDRQADGLLGTHPLRTTSHNAWRIHTIPAE